MGNLPKDQISTGAGQGADETTAATEPVRRPGPLPSKDLSTAIRAALEERPAWDNAYAATKFGSLLSYALGEIEGLQRQKDNLLETVNSKQAKIDALMLEFCPGEMSAEQRAEWAKHQQPSHEPTEIIRQMRGRAAESDAGGTIEVLLSDLRSVVTGMQRAAQPPPVGHDAERYRFLRQPGNAIVYARDRDCWGQNSSGHVRYDTPEQLDAAVDAARSAPTKGEGQ